MARQVTEGLRQLEEAFSSGTSAVDYWLDTGSGKLAVILPDLAGEPEMIAQVEQFAAAPERYIRVPRTDAREEYLLMRQFTEELPQGGDRVALSAALGQRNGARRFLATLNDYPRLRRRWDSQRKLWLDNRIRGWLKANDLVLADTAP